MIVYTSIGHKIENQENIKAIENGEGNQGK